MVEQDKWWKLVEEQRHASSHPQADAFAFKMSIPFRWCVMSWCHDIVQRGFCLCFHARDTNARVTIEVRVEAIMEAGMVLESSTHHISHVRRHVTIYDSIASCVILESIYNLVMEYVIIA